MAIPNDKTFFIGLILVILGTGLLKPNIGAMVGQLYSSKDRRRDAGYAIYYMGINLGSFFGYIICGYLATNMGWHWGFGAAAVGMGLGLIQYKLTSAKLNGAGISPPSPLSPKGNKTAWAVITTFLIAVAVITTLVFQDKIIINAVILAKYTAITFSAIFVLYYAAIYLLGNCLKMKN